MYSTTLNAIFAHGDNVILWEADLVAAETSGYAWQLRFVLVGWRKAGIEGIVERVHLDSGSTVISWRLPAIGTFPGRISALSIDMTFGTS